MFRFVMMTLLCAASIAKADLNADQYWTDIEALCMDSSGATHPPCNRSNGAKMILDEVQRNMEGNKKILKKAVEICIQYSLATHPDCNASNGLKETLATIAELETSYPKTPGKVKVPTDPIDIRTGEVARKPKSATTIYADQYWTDIESLCKKYSGATHPPCNRSNGAGMILDHVQQNCSGNKVCLKKAVDLCLQYSGATHPACNASNGLKVTLETLKSYENDYPKTQSTSTVPSDVIDIKTGEHHKLK